MEKTKRKNLLGNASLSLGFTFLAGRILSLGALDSIGSMSFTTSRIGLHGSQHQHYTRIY